MEVIIIVIVIILLIALGLYNSIVTLKKKVEQSYSTIDVYLTQRFNLIPNLVECVKGYTKHESEIFEKVTQARTAYMNTKNLDDAGKTEVECGKLIAVAESYPELKSSENYLMLQKQLSKLESQLQAARRLYNSSVTSYNTKISVFPTNMIANLFGFKEAKLFEIEDVAAKDNVQINIGE